jgi:hypothetical protein
LPKSSGRRTQNKLFNRSFVGGIAIGLLLGVAISMAIMAIMRTPTTQGVTMANLGHEERAKRSEWAEETPLTENAQTQEQALPGENVNVTGKGNSDNHLEEEQRAKKQQEQNEEDENDVKAHKDKNSLGTESKAVPEEGEPERQESIGQFDIDWNLREVAYELNANLQILRGGLPISTAAVRMMPFQVDFDQLDYDADLKRDLVHAVIEWNVIPDESKESSQYAYYDPDFRPNELEISSIDSNKPPNWTGPLLKDIRGLRMRLINGTSELTYRLTHEINGETADTILFEDKSKYELGLYYENTQIASRKLQPSSTWSWIFPEIETRPLLSVVLKNDTKVSKVWNIVANADFSDLKQLLEKPDDQLHENQRSIKISLPKDVQMNVMAWAALNGKRKQLDPAVLQPNIEVFLPKDDDRGLQDRIICNIHVKPN